MSDYTEEEFLALAKNVVRRVQTMEGAKFYGLPIGAIITADKIRAMKAQAAAKGVTPPKGALSKGDVSTGNPAPDQAAEGATPSKTTSPGKSKQAAPQQAAAKTQPDVVPPTITGPNAFKVGDSEFSAPSGSRLFRSKTNEDVAYVLTPDDALHVFNASGEVPVPEYLEPVLSGKFKAFNGEDSLYKEESFDTKLSKSLAAEKPGSILKKNGTPAFTKKDETTWVNEDLGVELTDEDLQVAFENGVFELQPATVEETDLSKMTEDELTSALEAFPVGKSLSFATTTLTKKDDGTWESSATGASMPSQSLADLAYGTNILADKPAPTPVQPKKKAGKKEERLDPLTDPEREINDANLQKKKAEDNLATGGEVVSAAVGDILYHDTVGQMKKLDNNTWEVTSSGAKFAEHDVSSSAGYGYVSKEPWQVVKLEEEQVKQEPEATPEAAKTSEDEPDTEEPTLEDVEDEPTIEIGGLKIPQDLYAEVQDIISSGKRIKAIARLRQGMEVISLAEAKAAVEAMEAENKNLEKQFLDTLSPVQHSPRVTTTSVTNIEQIADMNVGDTLLVVTPSSNFEYTMQKDGNLHHPTTGWFFTPDEFEGDVDAEDTDVTILPKAAPSKKSIISDVIKIGGTSFVPDEVDAAIESLEAHSGFQIKYGLKSLDEQNPLKDEEVLTSVVEEAKKAYPTLSPKAALVKHLKTVSGKETLGEPLADWEKELMGDKFVQIGSEDAKNTATGVTGGKYSQKDIQEAVDILEAFQGKAFKAELNKKGNPLGELSPNDIVGFNKDKTITKQNFIDLLKTKLQNVKTEESVSDEPDEWEKLLIDSPNTVASPEPSSMEDLEPAAQSLGQISNFPVGTSAYFNGHKYTKTSPNTWVNHNGVDFTDSAIHQSFVFDTGWSFKAPEPEVAEAEPTFENGHVLISDPAASKIGGQAGSNEGGLYKLPVSGSSDSVKYYYVKKAQTPEHGNNETLANALYAELGVKAPNVDFASDGNLYSEIVDGSQDMEDHLNDPKWLGKVQKDFAIDAWLSNRDVFGMTYDNVLTDDEGNPWRIDNGGALLYRAMGEKKSDFGEEVTELQIFRQGKKAKVFGPGVMSKENELDGASRIANLSPDTIREMVKAQNLPDSLADTLIARRKYVLDYYELEDPFEDQTPEFDTSSLKPGDKFSSFGQVANLPVGAQITVNFTYPGASPYTLYKQKDGGWLSESGEHIQSLPASMLEYVNFKSLTPEENVLEEEVQSPHGIAPGKYNSGKGAKAHLWVKPDGTGIYQGMKGIIKELDAEEVKKNFDLGMSNLVATPELSSYPGGPAVAIPGTVSGPNVIPSLGSVDSLPDGVYSGPFNTTYTVKGDEVVASKPTKSVQGVSTPVGKSPDKAFLEEAPVGSVIGFRWNATDVPLLVTKQEDGTWVGPGSSYVEYVGGYAYYAKRWKVESFPNPDEKIAKKASLKTKYLQGQLIDPDTSTSVVPLGYGGDVTFYGGATSISAIAAYRDFLADPDTPLVQKDTAHETFGVPVHMAIFNPAVEEFAGEPIDTKEKKLEAVVSFLNDYLSTKNVPTLAKAKDLLPKDVNGFYQKPGVLATNSPSYYDAVGVWSAYAQQLAASIGDGSVVGQNIKSGSKDQKMDWVSEIKSGNFLAAYKIEASIANSKNKPIPNAQNHPGHPINSGTHVVKWGPAVPGEIPAGSPIPGDWSSFGVSASLQEIDNYLILAKMQNPTMLSGSEKRAWVQRHRQGNVASVEHLSVMARDRALANHTPLSEPPVWTENVQPAKSYDHLFDDSQFPQTWGDYSNHDAAQEFFTDNVGNIPQLQEYHDAHKAAEPYSYSWKAYTEALTRYFKEQEDAYLEELNKPVYKVVRTISTGSHPTYIVQDQFDRKKIFKPLTPGKEWRAYNEAGAHNMGAALGFSVPKATIGIVNEGLPMGANTEGILMDFAPNIGSFGDVDGSPVKIADLTPKQLGQLASEHVFDWFLDNDDTHGENILVGESGELVAIDKGRAFLQYGHWFGLEVDDHDHMNVNTKDSGGNHVVYHQMVEAIKGGALSQEQLDAAYHNALKAAKRIQKHTDAKIEDLVRQASGERINWDIPDYAKDWPTLIDPPTSVDELVAAVLARKNGMVEDIEEMWTKLYAKSGMPKPEKPEKALGEDISSGWGESDLIENVLASKVWGTAPLHASPSIVGGASLLWTEKNAEEKDTIAGKVTVGSIAQKKILDFLSTKVSTGYHTKPTTELVNFPTAHVKSWKKTVTAAAKDVSNNATTGNYNTEVWSEMSSTEAKVDADLAFASSSNLFDESSVTFPSGVTMPGATIPQYVLALQHHKSLVETVELAKSNQVATDKSAFKDYVPQAWLIDSKNWSNPSGEKYKGLANGNWMHIAPDSVKEVAFLPSEVLLGQEGWTKDSTEAPEENLDPAKYSYSSAGQYAGELGNNGEKKVGSFFSNEGHGGSEYRVDLPTGERITFRNGTTTSTYRSQNGSIRFHLNPELEQSSSLANVESYLEKWGLDMTGATEDDAESVYWREMFKRLVFSYADAEPQSVQQAREKLMNMKSKLSTELNHPYLEDADLFEAIGLTQADERMFWNNLAVEAWGVDKVNTWIAEGRHLPKYQHMDLSDPEKSTGLPYFERIDVDLADIYAQGHMIAVGNKGKDKRHFDYIKGGGIISTEERLRILGVFKTGQSSTEDQASGGATGVFTRIAAGTAETSGALVGAHTTYWNPAVLAQTGTYSYADDSYGNWNYLQTGNPTNPVKALQKHHNYGNETLVQHSLSIYDFLELMVFDAENNRLKAIEEFKKLGINELRGVPIEERLVLRVNLSKAVTKMKQGWKA